MLLAAIMTGVIFPADFRSTSTVDGALFTAVVEPSENA
jgi:hypothetical protein